MQTHLQSEFKNSQTNQICDGYNPQVLMGNWYEESYSVKQPVRENPMKIPRDVEVDISFKNAYGMLTPLNRISRLPFWNTQGLVEIANQPSKDTTLQNQDRNKQYFKSVMKESYDLKTINNFHQSWKSRPYDKENQPIADGKTYAQLNKVKNGYQLFNSGNVEQLNVPRQSEENTFNSQIKENPHVDPKQTLETMYQSSFGQQNKLNAMNEMTRHSQQLTNTVKPPQWMANTRNYTQNYKPNNSSTKIYQENYFNKINMNKSINETNNSGGFTKTGFNNQSISRGLNNTAKQSQSENNFRRIRSEITLKNIPLIKTLK